MRCRAAGASQAGLARSLVCNTSEQDKPTHPRKRLATRKTPCGKPKAQAGPPPHFRPKRLPRSTPRKPPAPGLGSNLCSSPSKRASCLSCARSGSALRGGWIARGRECRRSGAGNCWWRGAVCGRWAVSHRPWHAGRRERRCSRRAQRSALAAPSLQPSRRAAAPAPSPHASPHARTRHLPTSRRQSRGSRAPGSRTAPRGRCARRPGCCGSRRCCRAQPSFHCR
jgi:hypothetical protein